MLIAPLPENEAARLEALRSYAILDTEDEEVFDDLTRLASQVCGVPVALVTLLDQHRQWFKSRVGTEMRETPRDIAFCTHTILQASPLVVEDMLADPRFADNPLVAATPQVRFYAGVPLVNPEGYALGTLCVIDLRPHKLSPTQLDTLQILGRQVVSQLELQRSLRTLRQSLDEHKQTEEALQRSFATNRALLDAMPDVMFRISRQGVFVNYKAHNEKDLFAPPTHFMNKALSEVLPEEVARPTLACVTQALDTGLMQILEYQLWREDGPGYFEGRFVVSDVDEVILIVRDITERKRAEEESRQALSKEKELSELRSRFVAMASHEFRTPLTTILSSAELLEHYSHRWAEEKKLAHLRRIQTAVNNMTQLLNDVLLFGKAEAGRLEFNPALLDLEKFCADLVEELQLGNGSRYKLNFVIHGEGRAVQLDEKLLRRILSNLLSNALKYSPEGTTVQFELSYTAQAVIFRVQDQGIGIAAEDLPQLFEPFHRGSNVGAISGTGLGLAIVKKSVDLQGGTIAVVSEPGKGTLFTVTLPLDLESNY